MQKKLFPAKGLTHLSKQQLLGFWEGDGSLRLGIDRNRNRFTAVIDELGFVFSQHKRNKAILDLVLATLAEPGKSIKYQGEQGTITYASNKEGGQKILEIFQDNFPINPGMFHNYSIFLLLVKIKKSKTLPLDHSLLELFQSKSKDEQKRLVMLVSYWLRFKFFVTVMKKNNLTLEDCNQTCNVTDVEKSEMKLFGEALYAPIERKYTEHIQNLKNDKIYISKDYLAFYHVADGCFTIDYNLGIGSANPTILLTPVWKITDDINSFEFLNRISRQYKIGKVIVGTTEKKCVLIAKGWKEFFKVLDIFNDPNLYLPEKEYNNVLKLNELVELHSRSKLIDIHKSFALTPEEYVDFIKKAYFFNVYETELGDNSKRTAEKFKEKIEFHLNKCVEYRKKKRQVN